MTATKNRKVQVNITHQNISVHTAGLKVTGFTALVFIAIISIVKLIKIICCLTWAIFAWVTPPVTRYLLRHAAGIYLGFRAFYTE